MGIDCVLFMSEFFTEIGVTNIGRCNEKLGTSDEKVGLWELFCQTSMKTINLLVSSVSGWVLIVFNLCPKFFTEVGVVDRDRCDEKLGTSDKKTVSTVSGWVLIVF